MYRKLMNSEIFQYGFWGVVTTLINIGVYQFFILLLGSNNYLIANTIAWIITIICAYITNKHFVFKSHNWKIEVIIQEVTTFTFSRLFSFFLEIIIMYIGVQVFLIHDIYVKIFANIFVILTNYILSKIWIFKK